MSLKDEGLDDVKTIQKNPRRALKNFEIIESASINSRKSSARLVLTIFIKNGEYDIDDMVAQVNVCHSFSDVFQCLLIDRCSSNVVEGKCDIYIIDIVKKMIKA